MVEFGGQSSSGTDGHVLSSVRFLPNTYDSFESGRHSHSVIGGHVLISTSFYPHTYASVESGGHSNSGIGGHVLNSVRFYPYTYDNVESGGHSNSGIGCHVLNSARFYRPCDSHDQTCYLNTTGHSQNTGHGHLKLVMLKKYSDVHNYTTTPVFAPLRRCFE